jgi:hypothetical protein
MADCGGIDRPSNAVEPAQHGRDAVNFALSSTVAGACAARSAAMQNETWLDITGAPI